MRHCEKCNKKVDSRSAKFCSDCRHPRCENCSNVFCVTAQQLRTLGWGRFCSTTCASAHFPKKHKKNGYWCIKAPQGHPKAWDKGYYYEHILVIETVVGRYLESYEVVHHRDGNRCNNKVENLELTTRQLHSKHHWPCVSSSEDVGIDHSAFSFIRRKQNQQKEWKPRIKGWRKHLGYIQIYNPAHPMSDKGGYAMEHRIIMANHLDRVLTKDEFVHHINGNRADNRLENLELVTRWSHPSRHIRY